MLHASLRVRLAKGVGTVRLEVCTAVLQILAVRVHLIKRGKLPSAIVLMFPSPILWFCPYASKPKEAQKGFARRS